MLQKFNKNGSSLIFAQIVLCFFLFSWVGMSLLLMYDRSLFIKFLFFAISLQFD